MFRIFVENGRGYGVQDKLQFSALPLDQSLGFFSLGDVEQRPKNRHPSIVFGARAIDFDLDHVSVLAHHAEAVTNVVDDPFEPLTYVLGSEGTVRFKNEINDGS